MTAKKLSVSMMCAGLLDIKEQIEIFKAEEIGYLHLDIMDGSFVPNFTLGTDYAKKLKQITDIPFDFHLMVDNPEKCIDWFPIEKGDYVSVHYEATRHVQRVLQMIKNKNAKTMVALNPATPICMIEDILDDINCVLLMTVNPGYAGQALIPGMLGKIKNLRNFLDTKGRKDIEIEVDGNVSLINSRLMSRAGANIFVSGSSGVFDKSHKLEESIRLCKEAINCI